MRGELPGDFGRNPRHRFHLFESHVIFCPDHTHPKLASPKSGNHPALRRAEICQAILEGCRATIRKPFLSQNLLRRGAGEVPALQRAA